MNEIQKAAKDHCSFYNGSHKCLLRRDTADQSCKFFRDTSVPLHCAFFEQAVVSESEALQRAYGDHLDPPTKDEVEPSSFCTRCGQAISKTCNRQKFCSACKVEAKRIADRERQRQHRTKPSRF